MVGIYPSSKNVKPHNTPASSDCILDNDPDGKPKIQKWNYRSAVGCLSYIQTIIRPDITMATQQCARFCNDPRQDHEEAVRRICRYLLKTKDKCLILRRDKSKCLECFVDADWAGSWRHISSNDQLSRHSRTGHYITYAGCSLMWKSKLQPLIALSTTEAEYIVLSSALREVIGIIHLLEELEQQGFHIHKVTPKITCKTVEDNISCINIATSYRTRPMTKHLLLRLHHFRSHVASKTITIEHISTKDQIAHILTKPLPRIQFNKLCEQLMSLTSLEITRERDNLMTGKTNPTMHDQSSHGSGSVISRHLKPFIF